VGEDTAVKLMTMTLLVQIQAALTVNYAWMVCARIKGNQNYSLEPS